MEQFITFTVIGSLACVGVVHIISWVLIYFARKKTVSYRVFPIGGEEADAGAQMSAFYTCLHWDSNPMQQAYVLFDAGLSPQHQKDCRTLAGSTGAIFVRGTENLEQLLQKTKSEPDA